MKLTKFAKKVMSELIESAKEGEVLTYGDLAEKIGQPGKTLCLPKVLGHISSYTYDELGVFLTAIVVNKDTGSPGQGFLQMASLQMELTHVLPDSFTQRHIKTIHALNPKELDKLMLVGTR